VVDTDTAVPGSGGTFSQPGFPALSDAGVAFVGGSTGMDGICLFTRTTDCHPTAPYAVKPALNHRRTDRRNRVEERPGVKPAVSCNRATASLDSRS
jgi:hypothetical protein